MSDALAYVAAGWGVVMALAPALQIRRMLARRSSGDVSVGYLCVLLVGFLIWIGYGLSLGNGALIVSNAVALVVGLATLVVAVRFRERERAGG